MQNILFLDTQVLSIFLLFEHIQKILLKINNPKEYCKKYSQYIYKVYKKIFRKRKDNVSHHGDKYVK